MLLVVKDIIIRGGENIVSNSLIGGFIPLSSLIVNIGFRDGGECTIC